jgi:hypothetical protein
MPKPGEYNEDTVKILAMSTELTNRQVADALGLDIDTVKFARKNHGVVYTRKPRDRGCKAKILSSDPAIPSKQLAKQLECTARYVQAVRFSVKGVKL